MSHNSFDPKTVRALAEILAETGLTEIEVENKEGRIRLARTPAVVMAPMQAPVAASVGGAGAVVAAAIAPAPAAVSDDAKHPGAVLSPMVGVAYLSAEPGSAPYVTVGQTVAVGQTLLLIEAMKTYNQIRAQKAGTVMRVLVETAQPVEYGQPLLVVE